MRVVFQSNVEPKISINTFNEESFQDVDDALLRIKNTPSGESLLKKINEFSKSGRTVDIFVTAFYSSETKPKLTFKQSIKYRSASDKENIARNLAVKKGIFKSEGTSATIKYNQFCEVIADSNGNSHEGIAEFENDATLFHELVHAMRILKGTYTDDLSIEGHEDEMLRAIGSMQYSSEPISENKFREQTGLQLRSFYPIEFVVPNTGNSFRPGLIRD